MNQHRAEDAATQAWFKAWRYRRKYDLSKGCYGSWLGAIVRNETFDLLKIHKKEVALTSLSGDPAVGEASAIDEPELGALECVFDAYEELRREKPEFAKVLSLKAQGYPERQIGEMLALCAPGTVGSRLSRSKQYIAARLAEKGVVFLAEGGVGKLHPMGLAPLCRTGDGNFYSFSPLGGLFVLPTGAPPPPGSNAVCEGFFVKLWSYSLDRFDVRIRDETSREGAIFSWNQYSVYAKDGLRHPVP